MSVHAFEQKRLISVSPGVEGIVQFFVLRPECQRNSTHNQDFSLHSAAAFLRLGCECRQLIQRTHVLANIRPNQREAALHCVTMTVDQSGHQEIALEVNHLRAFRHRLQHVSAVADGHNLVTANRKRFGVRMIGFTREYLAVIKHVFVRRGCKNSALKAAPQQQCEHPSGHWHHPSSWQLLDPFWRLRKVASSGKKTRYYTDEFGVIALCS